MRFLTYADLKVPRRLSAAFEKVRSAIQRDDFRSADVKKLVEENALFRARLDYDSRLIIQFVRYGGEKACLALEVIEQHAYDCSRFLRGARVDETKVDAAFQRLRELLRIGFLDELGAMRG